MITNKYKEIFLITTDTIPGLAVPMTEKGKNLLYDLKKRPKNKKIIIMVGNIEQARNLDGWTNKAEEYAKKYWPGQTTLVLNQEIAVRIPDVKGLRDLMIKKGPLYVTSANVSGGKELSFEEAKEFFNNIKKYYNFGEGTGKASKIIRVKDGEVLR